MPGALFIVDTRKERNAIAEAHRLGANLTKKHGVLLYSTCTLNPGENNQVARRFLLEHPDFEPYPVSLPEGYERNSFDRENEATLFVKKNGTDGFFFSGFRRLR